MAMHPQQANGPKPLYKLAIKLACFGFLVFLGYIIYLANTGQRSVFFDLVRAIPYGDKLGHFVLFGTLTALAVMATGFKKVSVGKAQLFLAVPIVSAVVLLEELSQGFFATRTFDLMDLLFDGLGIAVATLLLMRIETYTSRSH